MNSKLDDLYKMAKKRQTTQTDSGWNRKSKQSSNKDWFSNKFFLTNISNQMTSLVNTTICSVQFIRVQLFATPWITARQASLSITNSGVHSDSHPLSQWCHPAISSSVIPLSSCPQSLPASESFPMSQLFAWGGQSTGVSALASFLPKKSQGWSSE